MPVTTENSREVLMMELQKTKHEIKLAQWRKQVIDCRGSGMRVADWCREQGIRPSTYYRRQRQVWDAGVAQTQPQAELLTAQQWARLEPQTPSPTESGVTIEVGGCRVTATASTDPALLAQVCRMLKTL